LILIQPAVNSVMFVQSISILMMMERSRNRENGNKEEK